ncbi:MAG: sugar transferase, partial [Planctomycetota bacterium]
ELGLNFNWCRMQMCCLYLSMNLILIHKNSADNGSESLLRYALASEPIGGVILDGLSRCLRWDKRISIFRSSAKLSLGEAICAIPGEWGIEPRALQKQDAAQRQSFFNAGPNIISNVENVPIPSELVCRTKGNRTTNSWFVVSNGRFATRINSASLEKVLAGVQADMIAVNVEPELMSEREKVRLTTQGEVAGFRRLYTDSAEFAPVTTDWPHYLFVKTNVLDRFLAGGVLPVSFSALLERCRSNALTLRAINVGGTVLDLETENGLLNFCRMVLSRTRSSQLEIRNSNTISRDSRFIGKVLLGKNVNIGTKVIIVGPTIIGNDVKIESGAVINSSIIGPEICVPQNRLLQNCVVKGPQYDWSHPIRYKSGDSEQTSYPRYELGLLQDALGPFRTWPRFSYTRCFKRIADCVAAVVVLILFAPLIPFVALAIRLNSPGPVFYKDRRQGLHGKEFNCLKFRTMVTGADKIQEKLRIVSQVDGPQFKMTDDPRISTVGRFLRETYIDEIPQFFNVLFGQMSVVGPRPSPESENTLCPLWRDARLSVRPGITGLWQVYRTRHPMKDFQEWIHYDIKYVRNLSLKMDLLICWLTTRKLVGNFISQF